MRTKLPKPEKLYIFLFDRPRWSKTGRDPELLDVLLKEPLRRRMVASLAFKKRPVEVTTLWNESRQLGSDEDIPDENQFKNDTSAVNKALKSMGYSGRSLKREYGLGPVRFDDRVAVVTDVSVFNTIFSRYRRLQNQGVENNEAVHQLETLRDLYVGDLLIGAEMDWVLGENGERETLRKKFASLTPDFEVNGIDLTVREPVDLALFDKSDESAEVSPYPVEDAGRIKTRLSVIGLLALGGAFFHVCTHTPLAYGSQNAQNAASELVAVFAHVATRVPRQELQEALYTLQQDEDNIHFESLNSIIISTVIDIIEQVAEDIRFASDRNNIQLLARALKDAWEKIPYSILPNGDAFADINTRNYFIERGNTLSHTNTLPPDLWIHFLEVAVETESGNRSPLPLPGRRAMQHLTSILHQQWHGALLQALVTESARNSVVYYRVLVVFLARTIASSQPVLTKMREVRKESQQSQMAWKRIDMLVTRYVRHSPFDTDSLLRAWEKFALEIWMPRILLDGCLEDAIAESVSALLNVLPLSDGLPVDLFERIVLLADGVIPRLAYKCFLQQGRKRLRAREAILLLNSLTRLDLRDEAETLLEQIEESVLEQDNLPLQASHLIAESRLALFRYHEMLNASQKDEPQVRRTIAQLDRLRDICRKGLQLVNITSWSYYYQIYAEAAVAASRLMVDSKAIQDPGKFAHARQRMSEALEQTLALRNLHRMPRLQLTELSNEDSMDLQDQAWHWCQCNLLLYRVYMSAFRPNTSDTSVILDEDAADLTLANEIVEIIRSLEMHWPSLKLAWEHSIITTRRFAIAAESGTLWSVGEVKTVREFINSGFQQACISWETNRRGEILYLLHIPLLGCTRRTECSADEGKAIKGSL